MVNAFAMSSLDYCNSLYRGLPRREIDKVQRVQSATPEGRTDEPPKPPEGKGKILTTTKVEVSWKAGISLILVSVNIEHSAARKS